MDESELKEVLLLHKLWVEGDTGGKRAVLRNTDLSYANLCDANLCCADLRGADLSYANLNGAGLNTVNLADANLCCADLSGAELRRADLRYADLSGADLSGADLSGADLRYADLVDAILCRANLSWVDMSEADLSCACLNGSKCGFDAFFGSVKGAPIYQAVCGFGSRNAALTLLAQGEREEWRWFTGCFEGSEEELKKAVADKHGGSKEGRCYLRAIDYLIAQAEDNANSQQQS